MTSNPNTGTGGNSTGTLKSNKKTSRRDSKPLLGEVHLNPSGLEVFTRFLENLPGTVFRIAFALLGLLLFIIWLVTQGAALLRAAGIGSWAL